MLIDPEGGELLGTTTDEGQEFRVYRDRGTGLIFCRPFLTELPADYKQLYAGEAYHVQRQRAVGHVPYRDRYEHDLGIAAGRLAALRELIPEADSLLDIGCSNGAMVAAALAAGLDAYGCDLNAEILGEAVAQNGDLAGRLFVYDLETGTGPAVPAMPDADQRVLVLNDVVEHVVDVVAGLRALGQFFSSGRGALVIDTPDTAGAQFRDLGPAWHHVRPLEHAYLFNLENLTTVVETALPGARLVECRYPIPGKLVAYFLIASP